jgi:hypothetical protein
MYRVVFLFGALSFDALGFGQGPPQVPASEKQIVREEMRATQATRDSLRAQAKQAFDAEMARQKSGDCRDANNTYEANMCFSKQVSVTDQNLKTYAEAIRNLLSLKSVSLTSQPPPGPAGPQLTSDQQAAEFDHVEQLWRSYLDTAAGAAFHQFGGGTGGPSFEMQTHLQLVRSHMEELNNLYWMRLRL